MEGAEQLEFFPAPEAPLELKRRTFSEKSRELSLAFEPRIGDESPTIAAHGLLRVRRRNSTLYFARQLARPEEAR